MTAPWDQCFIDFWIDLADDSRINTMEDLQALMLPLPAGWELVDLDSNFVTFEVAGVPSVKDGAAVERDLRQLGLRGVRS